MYNLYRVRKFHFSCHAEEWYFMQDKWKFLNVFFLLLWYLIICRTRRDIEICVACSTSLLIVRYYENKKDALPKKSCIQIHFSGHLGLCDFHTLFNWLFHSLCLEEYFCITSVCRRLHMFMYKCSVLALSHSIPLLWYFLQFSSLKWHWNPDNIWNICLNTT